MPFIEILKLIAPVIIIALAGFVFRRYRKIEPKTLADLIIYLGSPCLVLTQLSTQRMELGEISAIALSAIFVILAIGLITYFVSRSFKLALPISLYLPIMFMNSGFIGFPLAFFAYGKPGLNYAIIYDAANAILLFTLGIYIISKEKGRLQFLKIPFIYAAALGLFFSFTGIKLPSYIFSPLSLLGSTVIPLALFMLGCHLAEARIYSWKLPLIASLMRLGFGLLLGLIAAFLFGLHGTAAKIVILLSSLSSAISNVAIADEYDRDPELVASTIALSTLLSVLVILIVFKWII